MNCKCFALDIGPFTLPFTVTAFVWLWHDDDGKLVHASTFGFWQNFSAKNLYDWSHFMPPACTPVISSGVGRLESVHFLVIHE